MTMPLPSRDVPRKRDVRLGRHLGGDLDDRRQEVFGDGDVGPRRVGAHNGEDGQRGDRASAKEKSRHAEPPFSVSHTIYVRRGAVTTRNRRAHRIVIGIFAAGDSSQCSKRARDVAAWLV